MMKAVYVITETLSSTLDPAEGLKRALQVAMETLDTEGGSILRHDPESRKLRFCHVVGEAALDLCGSEMPDSEGIAGQVFACGQPQIENDAARNPWHYRDTDEALGFETRNILTSPICYPGGKPVGVIQLVNKRSGDFDDDDVRALGIVASVAAMSVHNADLAEQAEKSAVIHYLGDIAHDIKNRATPIIMATWTLDQIMRDFDPGSADADSAAKFREDTNELLSILASHAEDIQRYTKFLADAAKGESIKPVMKDTDLGEVAVSQVQRLTPEAKRQGLTLTCEVGSDVTCPLDRFLVERAIYNLVHNAIPETPAGGVSVKVWRDCDLAVVEVRDTGRGMPSYVLERILNGSAVSTKVGGTGLGTTIVKRVVEAHGGRLEGESMEGTGTAFRMSFPCEKRALPDA